MFSVQNGQLITAKKAPSSNKVNCSLTQDEVLRLNMSSFCGAKFVITKVKKATTQTNNIVANRQVYKTVKLFGISNHF